MKCNMTNNALSDLKEKTEYNDIQIYELNKDDGAFIGRQCDVSILYK